jgi:hypothetical protein
VLVADAHAKWRSPSDGSALKMPCAMAWDKKIGARLLSRTPEVSAPGVDRARGG